MSERKMLSAMRPGTIFKNDSGDECVRTGLVDAGVTYHVVRLCDGRLLGYLDVDYVVVKEPSGTSIQIDQKLTRRETSDDENKGLS